MENRLRTEQEILDMIDLLNTDIENYQQLHEKGLRSLQNNKVFPKYDGKFKDAILLFKAQRQILKWVLGETFG